MDSKPSVTVDQLSKHFQVPTREAGLKASARSLVRRTYRTVKAVDGISFSIEPGEVVGFLGPNGAGKTTTLKMLAGLLYPTAGEAQRAGLRALRAAQGLPAPDHAGDGQPQPAGLGPAGARFLRAATAPSTASRRPITAARCDELIELLELKELVNKPVRNLSLGERMKVEIVGALLHRPAGALPG